MARILEAVLVAHEDDRPVPDAPDQTDQQHSLAAAQRHQFRQQISPPAEFFAECGDGIEDWGNHHTSNKLDDYDHPGRQGRQGRGSDDLLFYKGEARIEILREKHEKHGRSKQGHYCRQEPAGQPVRPPLFEV